MYVIIESPYAGVNGELQMNIDYARKCVKDCLERGEIPFASHLLYTQDGILDDTKPNERKLGINVGLKMGQRMDKTVVYTDLGISNGMQEGIKSATLHGRPIEYRNLVDHGAAV